MKKIFYLIFVIILCSSVFALQECKDILTPNEIPCIVKSTWSYTDCNLTEVKVYDSIPELQFITNFTEYGDSGRCNITWNISTIGSYFYNVTNGDSGSIIVQHEVDNMASLGIMLLVMGITAAIFWIGYSKDFTNNAVANNIIKKCIYIGGLWMLLLTVTIAVTISSNFGVGAEDILFRILWFVHKGAWIFTIVLFVTGVFGSLEMHKVQKMKRRMGYE